MFVQLLILPRWFTSVKHLHCTKERPGGVSIVLMLSMALSMLLASVLVLV